MPTLFVTGANRGIGYALADAYIKDGWRVLASCRSNPSSLPPGCEAIILDAGDPESIDSLKAQIGDTPIDLLWNNAGVYLDKAQGLDDISDNDWLQSFAINSIAPLRIASLLSDNVARSEMKLMVFTSTIMSSLTGNGSGAFAYRSSKAALNMGVRCLSHELAASDICTLMLHPGHVQTDMGGPEGAIDVATSVSGMRNLIASINPRNRSQFNSQLLSYDGSAIPW